MILLSNFTPFPGVRYKRPNDEHTSGEEFRDNVLIPALDMDKHGKIVVDLDEGVHKTILPSFLEESFAGLARIKKWTLEDFNRHVQIQTQDKEYQSDIEHYVKICNR